MDHLERVRQLPARLAAGSLIVALVLAGCVADDQETASFADGSRGSTTLPAVTEAPPTTAAVTEGDGDAAGGETGDEDLAEPADETTTTEPLDPLLGLDAELVADGFDQPILVAAAPGTDALFVVEREGVILVVEDGTTRPEPFLDLRDRLLSNSIEQGLLGLAFHPDYDTNGRLFAYWTDPEGDSQLAEFTATGPTEADPDSERLILAVDQPAERHNAGMIQFGPDGLLYLALGDGGSGGSTAQDTSNLLGTIVRLDVDGAEPYAIPPDNPFGDEIWVYGLRNPWRFSIDPVDELVYIGDVGQEGFEEINVIGLDGGGTNFGWFEMEGDQCFRAGCDTEGLTPPVLQYSHAEGCSVTGGWVYRGTDIPELYGHYFFGDWCKSFVRSLRMENGRATDQLDWGTDLAAIGQVTSFGIDNRGELYAVNWDGQLYRIVARR